MATDTAVLPAALTELVGALDVGVLVIDRHDRVVLANDALAEVFDPRVSGSGLVGLALDAVARLHPYRAAAALWQGSGRRQVSLCDGRVVQGVWHELGAAEYGGRARMLVVADVTADAAIRRRLREHNRALAELVAARTELVTALLHELRSPLTSMSAMLDLLPGPTGQADVDAVLDVVVRNTGRLNAAVEEMATISGLETNTVDLDLADVDVAALVETAVTRWKDEVRVTADVTGGPPLQGDPGWLAELVDRLIAVAVTTAPPRSTVTVQAAPDDDGWRLAVPVTSDQTADRLFTSAQGRGTATALMLARAVVARHNGTLRVVPGPDASAMVVRLPYRQKLLGANAARLDGPGRAGPAPGRAGRAG